MDTFRRRIFVRSYSHTISGALGFIGITGGAVDEPQECPVCQSGNKCVFQQTTAKFERSGDVVNENGILKGNAKLTNTIKNTGKTKALFNLHARCKTINKEKDVYSGWDHITPGDSKELTAEMNTGFGDDWKCNFVEVQSIDIENSCNLITV